MDRATIGQIAALQRSVHERLRTAGQNPRNSTDSVLALARLADALSGAWACATTAEAMLTREDVTDG